MTEPIARPVRGGRAGLEPATNGLPTGLTRPEQLTIRHSSGRVIDDDGSLIRACTPQGGSSGVPTASSHQQEVRRGDRGGAVGRPHVRTITGACARSCCVEASHTGAMRQVSGGSFSTKVLFAVLGDVKVCGRGHFTAGMNAPSVVSSVAAIDGKLRTALIRSSRARNSLPIATGRPRSSSSPTGA